MFKKKKSLLKTEIRSEQSKEGLDCPGKRRRKQEAERTTEVFPHIRRPKRES